MTPLYIICYMLYKTLTSTIFSLLLGLRLLLRCLFPSVTTSNVGNVIALYEGTLRDERLNPVHNSFKFTIRYALLDLDQPPYSPPMFLSADEARKTAKTNGAVYLLTILPSLGYQCSPVNYYCCYDIQGSTKIFKKCIVEATNTPWGESVTFVFNPSSDSVPKCEYISPFSDMVGNWRLRVSEPGDDLYASIIVEHPDFGNNYLTATLKAKKVNISSTTPDDLEAFFLFQPHKVSIISYLVAMKLLWKNARFYEHPRKENPNYRREAVARTGKDTICPAFGGIHTSNNLIYREGTNTIDRCYMWKDAPWPWSCLISPHPSSSH